MNGQIKFLDLGRLHQSIRGELDEAITTIVDTSRFIGGAPVSDFEFAFTAATQSAATAGCNSGTDALGLALRALGIGPSDEVIVPSMTFIATAEAVLHVGATPVLADVHADTLLLTEETVAAVRTDRTRAVVPVHLYGHAVDTNAMRNWRDSGLLVIEDAAQAHLATSQEVPIGTVGHAACYSFFPSKNLGAFGDAGAVTSSDPEVVAEVRRLRDHGRIDKYRHDVLGYSSRMDSLQAAVLEVKLRHLPAWTKGRRAMADAYRDALDPKVVSVVPWNDGAVHHLFVVRVVPESRDRLRAALADRGVATGVHYPIPLSRQPALRRSWRPCPATESAADSILSLPIDPLMTEEDLRQVVSAVHTEMAGL